MTGKPGLSYNTLKTILYKYTFYIVKIIKSHRPEKPDLINERKEVAMSNSILKHSSLDPFVREAHTKAMPRLGEQLTGPSVFQRIN